MNRVGLRGIVEAAYRLSVPRSSWLEGIGRAAEATLGQDCGTVTGLIDATDIRRARVLEYSTTRSIADLDRVLERTVLALDPKYVDDSRKTGALLATEAEVTEQPGIRLWLDAFGARDLLTVLAMDASGIGVIVAINLAEPAHAEARQNPTFAQLGAHVLGAYRLRESPPTAEDAVFRRSGEVVNASHEIREAGILADLTNAVRALDDLHDGRTDEARALEAFTSRVDATWSIVAELRDGPDEWIVAKRNPSGMLPLPEILSQRESQVMTLLFLGCTPKVVAYELGIAHSTVRVLISRAVGKLGAKTLEEVIARFAAAS